MFGGSSRSKAMYFKKKKHLALNNLTKESIQLIKLIGGSNVIKTTSNSVVIDVARVDDVDQALSMIAIVTEVRP
jgi:hypothetical protein